MEPEFDINLDVIDNDKKDVSANNKKDNKLSVSRDCIFDVFIYVAIVARNARRIERIETHCAHEEKFFS